MEQTPKGNCTVQFTGCILLFGYVFVIYIFLERSKKINKQPQLSIFSIEKPGLFDSLQYKKEKPRLRIENTEDKLWFMLKSR